MGFVGRSKLENAFLGVTKSLAMLARSQLKKLTACCSVKEIRTVMHSIWLHKTSSSTAQYREPLPGLWKVAALRGSAAGLYPLFISTEHSRHGRAGAASNLLVHQKPGTAFTEQSITAGESVPTQGQSRRVVTLPILQVGHHEIENLNDIPKTTLGDKELNGYLKSLVITQNRCLTCVPFLVHKWLHSARRLLTATEQTLLGVCTHLLQQGHAEQTQGLQNSKF